jgi:hypothetical protein
MPEKPGSEWAAVRAGVTLRGVAALPFAALAWAGHMLTFLWLGARKSSGLAEAQAELRRLVSEHEGQGYSYWVGHVGKGKHLEFTTSTGTTYQAVWPTIRLRPANERIATRLLVWGAYGNWAVTLLASMTGAKEFAPHAGAGYGADVFVEKATLVLITMFALTGLAGLALVLSGLSRQG